MIVILRHHLAENGIESTDAFNAYFQIFIFQCFSPSSQVSVPLSLHSIMSHKEQLASSSEND